MVELLYSFYCFLSIGVVKMQSTQYSCISDENAEYTIFLYHINDHISISTTVSESSLNLIRRDQK